MRKVLGGLTKRLRLLYIGNLFLFSRLPFGWAAFFRKVEYIAGVYVLRCYGCSRNERIKYCVTQKNKVN
jgi:hypothetical protein